MTIFNSCQEIIKQKHVAVSLMMQEEKFGKVRFIDVSLLSCHPFLNLERFGDVYLISLQCFMIFYKNINITPGVLRTQVPV